MPQTLIPQLENKLKTNRDFRGIVKFDIGENGILHVDATARPATISTDDKDATLTLTLTKQLLQDLLTGTADPNVAYLTGKLKIKGPLSMALKLNAFLEN